MGTLFFSPFLNSLDLACLYSLGHWSELLFDFHCQMSKYYFSHLMRHPVTAESRLMCLWRLPASAALLLLLPLTGLPFSPTAASWILPILQKARATRCQFPKDFLHNVGLKCLLLPLNSPKLFHLSIFQNILLLYCTQTHNAPIVQCLEKQYVFKIYLLETGQKKKWLEKWIMHVQWEVIDSGLIDNNQVILRLVWWEG